MSEADTVAKPYAKAIFEIAIQNNSILEWKNILVLMNIIASSKKVKNFLSGSLSPQYLALFFISISKDILNYYNKNINIKIENLIKLLAENKRFLVLNNILEEFLKLEACYKNIIIVELKSAFLLKEKQILSIRKILEKYLLKKIKLICQVEPHILDGIIIKINNTVIDLSVQNYLKQLSSALKF